MGTEYSGESAAQCLLASAYSSEPYSGFDMSHAEVIETSEMMVLHPDCVDMTQLPPVSEPLGNTEFGIVDAPSWKGRPTPDHMVRPECDPRLHASAEIGRGFLQQTVNELEPVIRTAFAG